MNHLRILPARRTHRLHVYSAEMLQIDAAPTGRAAPLLDQIVVGRVETAVPVLAAEFIAETVTVTPVQVFAKSGLLAQIAAGFAITCSGSRREKLLKLNTYLL